MTPRRRRFVLLLAALLGLPVFGAVLGYFWINQVTDRKWAHAEERIRELSAAFPEGGREPETRSEAAKENQIHFVAAIRLAAPMQHSKYEAWGLLSGRKSGPEVDSFLDEAQEFLDRVHQGARRIAASPADFPPRWHGDWDEVTLRYLMQCGVLRARRQRERHVPFDAAETLLDSLQLGRFWAISGKSYNRMYALGNLTETLEEFRDLICNEPISPDQLRKIEVELEPLDAAIPSPYRDLEPTLARWGEMIQALDLRENGILDGAPYRWRYLLPGRLMKAEAHAFADERIRRLLAGESQGYAEILRQCRLVRDEAYESKNPLLQRTADFFEGRWPELERMAQLRLLRAAAHYRATGEFVKADDPYGTVIQHAEKGDRVRFWSRGDDGVDDGGDLSHGRWTRPEVKAGVPTPEFPKDLGIEVPRRP